MRPGSAQHASTRPRSRSAVAAMRARCAAESAREQMAERASTSRAPSYARVAANGRSGSAGDSSTRHTARHTADGPGSSADETVRPLPGRWESAGRLLRRLPATTVPADDSNSSESDDEQSEPGIGWVAPSALAFDVAGSSAAILDGAEIRLYTWLPKLQLWLQRGAIGGAGLIRPQGVAALAGGELAVADAHRRSVVVFDSDGLERRTIGRGLTRGSLVRPTALASDASGAMLAVFDIEPARVQLHRASTGALLRTFALDSLGVTSVPVGGISFDGSGHILVCDPAGQRVLRLRTFDGGCSATLSSDQLSCPGAVTALSDGTAIVGNRSTLQVFRPDGHWLCSVAVGRGGNASSQSMVAAIAVDACGHLFVAQQQVRPDTGSATNIGGGNLLVLSGPGPAAQVQETATAASGPSKELPSSAAGSLESNQQLRRRRRAALLLKEQLLTAIVDRKLTIRGLFSTAGSDGGGRQRKIDAAQASTNEQRVESAQLAAALRRLGLNASQEEVCELLSLLALAVENGEDTHARSEDACCDVLTMEVPTACFVSFRQLEQLKLVRISGSISPVAESRGMTTPKDRRRQQPQHHEAPANGEAGMQVGVDDAAALRALRTLVALSPSQENEKRHWEFYDNQVAAARAADRPIPNHPSVLIGQATNRPGRKLGNQKSSPDLLSAYHTSALSPCVEAPKSDLAVVARDSLLALSLDTPMDDAQ